jgi:hypothetical protein
MVRTVKTLTVVRCGRLHIVLQKELKAAFCILQIGTGIGARAVVQGKLLTGLFHPEKRYN